DRATSRSAGSARRGQCAGNACWVAHRRAPGPGWGLSAGVVGGSAGRCLATQQLQSAVASGQAHAAGRFPDVRPGARTPGKGRRSEASELVGNVTTAVVAPRRVAAVSAVVGAGLAIYGLVEAEFTVILVGT